MANKTSKKKPAMARTKKPGKKALSPIPREPSLLGKHINMIIDPCAAPLTETAYTGQSGTIQRFVTTGVLNSTTQTAGYIVVVPGGFRISDAVQAGGGTSFTAGYGAANIPGYTFLNGSASGVRVVGACIQLHWNSSEATRGGTIACGTIPASSWQGGATVTIDSLVSVLPRKERVPSGECEIVWNPSQQDMNYERMDGAVSQTDFDDKNAMAFCYLGPAGFSIFYTITVIYEWTPKAGLGQPAHPTLHRSILDPIGQLNTTLVKMGFQNKPLRSFAKAAISTLAEYTPAGNALKVVKTGAKLINTLLP